MDIHCINKCYMVKPNNKKERKTIKVLALYSWPPEVLVECCTAKQNKSHRWVGNIERYRDNYSVIGSEDIVRIPSSTYEMIRDLVARDVRRSRIDWFNSVESITECNYQRKDECL